MDALRKQASKLREQVAKQQQAVIKQFGGTGYESSDVMVIDEVELQRHQQLEKLYRSTRNGRHIRESITKFFICLLQVTHTFNAESEKELSLSVGDYVVVRKVSPSGWSEGECRGNAGWFPSAYVEKRQRIPTADVAGEVY
ncbi:SH3 domain-containing protein 3 [Quercus suber]|uniref:SH3 domain-containing protein 3 n=1 Tax=Quercus suber TaxID=58331 RepID=UPI0032DE9734